MRRTAVLLVAVLLTACANSSPRQEATAGCRLSPNPKALSMDCGERKTAQNLDGAKGLCPGSLNPKLQGSVFCAR